MTRVPKHLEPRCLDARPDIVVLQFATSDPIVPIRKERGSIPKQRKVLAHPAKLRHWLRWRCRGLLVDALRLPPVTPVDVYLQTMEQLARTLVENQIVPIVLSPFVFGGQRSNSFARDCTRQLGQMVNSLPNAVYVDAYSALDKVAVEPAEQNRPVGVAMVFPFLSVEVASEEGQGSFLGKLGVVGFFFHRFFHRLNQFN